MERLSKIILRLIAPRRSTTEATKGMIMIKVMLGSIDRATNQNLIRLLEHPRSDRFDCAEFADAIANTGFRVIDMDERFRLYAWFMADKI